MMKNIFYGVVICILGIACKQETKEVTVSTPRNVSEAFKEKWYAGKAEITSYDLVQARYGELRNGEATLIFVTEDFSKDKLVKLDDPASNNNKVRVMKMNFMKKFITGIYPYSMMTSAFTPIEEMNHAIKITCSSQEWCGHTFSQMELSGKQYDYTLHSYFESEGEQHKKIESGLSEDDLWNQLRVDPKTLPTGNHTIIPSFMYLRLTHLPMEYQEAQLALLEKDSATNIYSVSYPNLQRTLRIQFAKTFPFEIIGWEESYPDGFGDNKKMLTTTATKKKTIWLDYWKYNNNESSKYRDSLLLQ